MFRGLRLRLISPLERPLWPPLIDNHDVVGGGIGWYRTGIGREAPARPGIGGFPPAIALSQISYFAALHLINCHLSSNLASSLLLLHRINRYLHCLFTAFIPYRYTLLLL